MDNTPQGQCIEFGQRRCQGSGLEGLPGSWLSGENGPSTQTGAIINSPSPVGSLTLSPNSMLSWLAHSPLLPIHHFKPFYSPHTLAGDLASYYTEKSLQRNVSNARTFYPLPDFLFAWPYFSLDSNT